MHCAFNGWLRIVEKRVFCGCPKMLKLTPHKQVVAIIFPQTQVVSFVDHGRRSSAYNYALPIRGSALVGKELDTWEEAERKLS